MLPTKLFGKDLHRALVDDSRSEVDVIDAEGVLYHLGDLLEGEYVAVDKCLRDVWFLLKAPALDQLRRDAGHGPN